MIYACGMKRPPSCRACLGALRPDAYALKRRMVTARGQAGGFTARNMGVFISPGR